MARLCREARDFMHGLTTNRHEGGVSTMLTEQRLEYSTVSARLQGSRATQCREQDNKPLVSGAFRLEDPNASRTRNAAEQKQRDPEARTLALDRFESESDYLAGCYR